MSYALLWIEMLLACLFLVAVMAAVELRRKTRMARVLCFLVALLPQIPPVLLLWLSGMLKIVGFRNSRLGWAIALFLCCIAGSVVIQIAGRRRSSSGVAQALSWPRSRIASAWLVVVSLMVMTLWNLDLRAQVEIQGKRAEAGAIALSAALSQIPASANAALVYERANKEFAAATTSTDKDVDYSKMDPLSPAVQEYLQRQQKALEVLRQAADMPECRFDFDLARPDMQKLLDQWPKYRIGIRLLALAARAEAAAGNGDIAAADLRRVFAVAGHTGSAPALIGGLVTIVNDSVACRTAAEVLPSVSSKEQLDRLGSVDPNTLPRAFARALRSEEALGLALNCDTASGTGIGGWGITPSYGHFMWLAFLQDHVAAYQGILRRTQKMAELPYYQTVGERQQLKGQGGPDSLSKALTPSLLQPLADLAKGQVLRASVAVACAATRYRLDHGQYPATSDLLMPGYLETMPVDPFDGQAMRMKKLPDGSLVIYSVGADGKDDGGVVESTESKAPPSDVGITLKMPAKLTP